MNLPKSVIKNTKNIKIETPFGFEDFYGVNKITKSQYVYLKFTNNKELKCSLDHPLDTIEGIVRAKDLTPEIEIYTKTGGCFVTNSEIINESIDLYDIVNSGTKHLYYSNDIVSHNCEFLGSANTLISGSKLKTLVYQDPIISNAGLDIYETAVPGHDYVTTVDVSEGLDLDYSAFTVIDITSYPHRLVAKYRNNGIKPIMFPNIIESTAKQYNKAFILCEVNGLGDQVASILHYDLEYPNILMCAGRGRNGQVLGQGFSGKKSQLGVKMSRGVKQLGCSNLKALIEDNKLTFKDYDIISELTTFVQKSNGFAAEEGENDDLTMCLVSYAWMVTQDYFKELTEQDIRRKIYDERKNEIEQDMAPFGFILDGTEEETIIDGDGDIWHVDEYGDKSHEFSYMWNNF